jgi:hypothetical protein
MLPSVKLSVLSTSAVNPVAFPNKNHELPEFPRINTSLNCACAWATGTSPTHTPEGFHRTHINTVAIIFLI